ncbi:MAG: redoxin domain-containing protein [Dehalococcoidia bacterium]|nr:redoxin domain-containing protein [Dehalococcoidia bacterium]
MRISIGIFLLVAAMLLVACESKQGTGSFALTPVDGVIGKSGLKVGNAVPDFTLKTPDGADMSLSSLRGKPVVVNFWATWCEPCKQEMPHFQEAYDQYSKTDGLAILAVNMNENGTKALAFFQEHNLSFPSVLDSDQKVAVGTFGIIGLPTSYFIDAKGIIMYVKIGPFLTNAELKTRLEMIGVKAQS